MIYVLVFVAILGVCLVGYLLYALDQRLGRITVYFQTQIAQMNKDLSTLHDNQKTLENDLKTVFGELQNAKKEVKRSN